jgi:hypothetical protein
MSTGSQNFYRKIVQLGAAKTRLLCFKILRRRAVAVIAIRRALTSLALRTGPHLWIIYIRFL